MAVSKARVPQKHEIIRKWQFVFLRNTRSVSTRAMLCPVMVNNAKLALGVVAAGRRAKSSGTGLPRLACPRSLSVSVTPSFHMLVPSSNSCLPSQFLLLPLIRLNPGKSGHRKSKSRTLAPCSSFCALPTCTFQLSAFAPSRSSLRPLRLRVYLVFFPNEPIWPALPAAQSQCLPQFFKHPASPSEPISFPVFSISSASAHLPIHPNQG
jgi:hypothetical protein